jgi:copper(I)-binding protein
VPSPHHDHGKSRHENAAGGGRGLEIKPGETVMLKPSSPHLMFLGLKHPLEQGNTVAATLQFEKAGTTRSFQSPQSERRPPALPRARQHR